MTGPERTSDQAGAAAERRGGRRRSYNRRLDDREVSPPYFEVFERIAAALEGIEEQLSRRELKLPEAHTHH